MAIYRSNPARITKRDVLNYLLTAPVDEEVKQYAKDEKAKMDKRNASRSSKPSKTAVANEPIKAAIMEYITANAKAIASDIAAACDISTQKVSALCRQLVEDSVLTACEVKVPKKGKVKAYSVPERAEVDE